MSLRFAPGAVLHAIGSRSSEKADRLAALCGAQRGFGSYEQLVADPAIDVVYVATPHTQHKAHCLLALKAGKAVLCEKPFTTNSEEAQEVIAFARQQKLFCMEAMWMHFVPGMRKAIELIRGGAIGEPRMLVADFGYPTQVDAQSRFFDPALGGGALLDRGVYPLALAFRVFGKPTEVASMAALAVTGVDEHCSISLKYADGQLATLGASLTGYATNQAVVIGTTGRITIHEPLCRPDRLTLAHAAPVAAGEHVAQGWGWKDRLRASPVVQSVRHELLTRVKPSAMHVPCAGNGYNYEASEVVSCLVAGVTESTVWSLDQTASLMQTLDVIRSRWLPQ